MSQGVDISLILRNSNNEAQNIADLLGGEDVTFHNDATTAQIGNIVSVGSNNTLTIEIFGTATTRNLSFKGISASGVARTIKGVNLGSFATATLTIGINELWQFDITGLDSVSIPLNSVSGGNIYVKGRMMA
jgi:hypothetical protein